MANAPGVPKRAWKLQEFIAHGASVNCVSLGHKSGRVLVTGGDDKKVNLWAVGKPNCIMSLVGHTTPIECVRFGQTEEMVVAGSASGALKIWDLEAAKLLKTLTGHKAGLTCTDFHPYGDFLASGSADKCLKLWDIRRKGCIFTYKGHANRVNSIKFSPDGQWIASAGEDAAVRLWDLRAGKLMTEFIDHEGPVFDVEFHPHEFLLASSSQDRTVNFWDLENFNKVSNSDKDMGPIRTIVFHPEGNTLFSGSHDTLKIHQWEPGPRTCDVLGLGWGKIRDMAVSGSQLIGVSYSMSNVSVYVVDLKRVSPFNGKQVADNIAAIATPTQAQFKGGMRRSFVKDKAGGQRPQVKVSDEQSDKSGTDPEDSDGTAYTSADINDVQNYESIFRPRRRELNRTPPAEGEEYDEPFQAPLSGSESENNIARPTELRLTSVVQATTRPSPSPTRRQSQPAAPPGYGGSPVRVRRGSNPTTPTGLSSKPVYESVPSSAYLPPAVSASPTRTDIASDYRSGSSARNSPDCSSPLTSVSRIQISQQQARPLDKPTMVRPVQRTSVHIPPEADNISGHSNSPPVSDNAPDNPFPVMYPSGDPYHHHQPHSLGTPSRKTSTNELTLQQLRARAGNTAFTNASAGNKMGPPFEMPSPEKKIQVVPMNADKPTGLQMDEFLPKKFAGLGLNYNTDSSKYSSYKDYSVGGELSESEVTSSVLKGHDGMMAVLTTRGRNMEIIQKLWQSKDAKAAVDQAVSLNDQAIMVDFLSVITLRPSIWNLDLCESLLPTIGDLLQSKYEMYIHVGCGAAKLILKNFASVIKSNIDSPVQTVGVDISREERHRKCMQCYKDLVKIRSLIIKRQSIQGKLGHTFRELAILMQYLD